MSEIPDGWKIAAPRPTAGDAHQDERTEQCPRCLAWLKPKKDGRIRVHSRVMDELDENNRPLMTYCTGSNTEDRREYMVFTAGARYHVRGRRSAEVIARKQTDPLILERS